MAVGNAEDFEDALQRAVLARTAVQHVERDVGLQHRQHGGDVAADIDLGDAVAVAFGASAQALPERRLTSRSADQPPISTATCLLMPRLPQANSPEMRCAGHCRCANQISR